MYRHFSFVSPPQQESLIWTSGSDNDLVFSVTYFTVGWVRVEQYYGLMPFWMLVTLQDSDPWKLSYQVKDNFSFCWWLLFVADLLLLLPYSWGIITFHSTPDFQVKRTFRRNWKLFLPCSLEYLGQWKVVTSGLSVKGGELTNITKSSQPITGEDLYDYMYNMFGPVG